jgi:DNA-binding NarL/FixJ family response regulator
MLSDKPSASKIVGDLSNRELEVLQLIVDGFTNMEIADKLFISNRTVDTHRRNLLQKLNVRNTAELVKFALKNGLVE